VVGVGREIVLPVMKYVYHGKSGWEGEEEEGYLYFELIKGRGERSPQPVISSLCQPAPSSSCRHRTCEEGLL
jgi:hypothetical protein